MTTESWDEVTQCLMCDVSPVVVAAALANASGGWLDVTSAEMTARWSARRESRERPAGSHRESRLLVDFAAAAGQPACRLTGQVSVASMAGGGSLVSLQARLVPAPSGHTSGRELPIAPSVRSSGPWRRRSRRAQLMSDLAVVPRQAPSSPQARASAPTLCWALPLVTVLVLGGFTVYGAGTAPAGGLSTWGP